jgi:steroid delta-isomerase-like uncharacterized protein
MTDPAARTREIVMPYFDSAHADVSMMADDVVFVNMTTGDETRTPQAVLGMLQYFYQIAFDATAEPRNLIFHQDHAVWEGTFVGQHIGEFAGIPATGNQVRVPLVIVYDVAHGQIQKARIYLDMASMMAQLGVTPGG